MFQIMEGPKEGSLFLFEVGSGATEVAPKVLGVAGASDDLQRIYFVSEKDLDGSGPALNGKPNLYLVDEGVTSYIATLASEDVQVAGEEQSRVPNDTSLEPVFHAAQASANGASLVFVSTGKLTGYDNNDLNTSRPDSEAYVYRLGDPGPLCISCNPGGARPRGRLIEGPGHSAMFLPTAGTVPAADFQLSPPRVVSADGNRAFFDSYDALLPRDQNEAADVYEWEAADSSGSCERLGAEIYSAANGGCLSLISSGDSPRDAELLDASTDGRDVFFTTAQGLLPQDPGLIDVYDARADGGLPSVQPPQPCEGEQCQPQQAPAEEPRITSTSPGPGNPPRKCPRGRRKAKRHGTIKCGKKHKTKHHHKKKSHKKKKDGTAIAKGNGHLSDFVADAASHSDGGAK
jgi:hypothetical protein